MLTIYFHKFLAGLLLFIGILVIIDVVARVGAMLGFFLRCFGLLADKVAESRGIVSPSTRHERGLPRVLLIVEVIHGV